MHENNTVDVHSTQMHMALCIVFVIYRHARMKGLLRLNALLQLVWSYIFIFMNVFRNFPRDYVCWIEHGSQMNIFSGSIGTKLN